VPSWLPEAFLTLFQAQSHIGWDQILKGRFSLTWLPLISNNTFFCHSMVNLHYKKIWNTWYDMWKHRCDVSQGETPESKTARLKQKLYPQVQKLYDEIENIDPTDHYIFNHTQEELLTQSTYDIEKWIRVARFRIKDSIHRVKLKTKQTQTSMHQFFVKTPYIRQIRQYNQRKHKTKN
jgi:hypothetical protein